MLVKNELTFSALYCNLKLKKNWGGEGVLEELKCSFASSILGFLHKLPDFGPSGVGTKCPCSTSPTVSQQHLAKKSPLCLWRTRQELPGLSNRAGMCY